MARHCGGNRDHERERRSALLHASAARGRGEQQGQLLRSRALDAANNTTSGCGADRTAEEAELRTDDGDALAADGAFAGDNGLIETGFLSGAGQCAAVGLVDVAVLGRAVPGCETSVVEDGIYYLLGAESSHTSTVVNKG